jgi:DNA-binding Lrp family transcriptional regulator
MTKGKDNNPDSSLDVLDLNIVRMLQEDSRQSCRTIAKSLHTSPGTVSERIKRLVNKDVIRKFTAIIDPVKVGKLYTMFLMVRLESQYKPDDVVKDIMNIDGSCCIHNITGNYHLHLLIRATDNHTAAELLDRIRAIKGIERIDSYVVLRSFRAFYEVPI